MDLKDNGITDGPGMIIVLSTLVDTPKTQKRNREKVQSWPFPENDPRHKGNKTEGNRHAQPQ